MRGGRCGDGDGRAGEGVVVDGVVIAIARVLHDADDGAAVGLSDVVSDLLAGDGGLEGLDLVGLFVAFLHDENGTHLVSVLVVHVEPMGLYGGKQTSLDALNK